MKKIFFSFLAVFFLAIPNYSRPADYDESAGLFGVGGGYTGGFVPHKNLKKYNGVRGFFVSLNVVGNAYRLVYHRDILELEKEIVDKYNIDNPEATLRRLTLEANIPIPIVGEKNFALAPTINYGLGGYRFVLSKDAYNKLGKTNLTKMHNKDVKFGQNVGIGLSMTFFQRVNLNLAWNVDWVVKDYKAWYLITSSLVPLFIDETENFTKVMLGLSFMFGKNL